MAAAARWIDENAGKHDRYLLFVDEFDPHEPFDTPERWSSLYDPDWIGPHLIWPPYIDGALRRGVLDERMARQIRAQYGAKLSMIDHWFGEVVAALDRNEQWDSTAVIVVTDHGHYLGESDRWGKPAVPVERTLGHIPLMVWWPGLDAGTCDALTTSVDVFATLADVFGVEVRQRTHGKSMVPLLQGEVSSIRDWLLTGVWGREVQLVDKQRRYCRAPAGDNAPISIWSNRWSTMPVSVLAPDVAMPLPDQRATLASMPGSTVPVIHQQWDVSDRLAFWAWGDFSGNHLWDRYNDPTEERDRVSESGGDARAVESDASELLRHALTELEAPADQFERLGLK